MMQVQLVRIDKENAFRAMRPLSQNLGYVPVGQLEHDLYEKIAVHTSSQWWKAVLSNEYLGRIIDAEVDTDDGPISSNQVEDILSAIDDGGKVFYVTFVRKIAPEGQPMMFSLYRGGQLTFAAGDEQYLSDIVLGLPTP